MKGTKRTFITNKPKANWQYHGEKKDKHTNNRTKTVHRILKTDQHERDQKRGGVGGGVNSKFSEG